MVNIMSKKFKTNIDMCNNKIQNLGEPVNDDEACNKGYVLNYVNQEIQSVSTTLGQNISQLDSKVDTIETELTEEISSSVQALDTELSTRIQSVEQTLTLINADINTIKSNIQILLTRPYYTYVDNMLPNVNVGDDITNYIDEELFSNIFNGSIIPVFRNTNNTTSPEGKYTYYPINLTKDGDLTDITSIPVISIRYRTLGATYDNIFSMCYDIQNAKIYCGTSIPTNNTAGGE